MLPDMTHINWNNTLRFTGIAGYTLMKRKTSQPGHQDLHHTVAQASGIRKTWKLAQCWNSTDSNQSIWINIDLHDYRN